MAAGLGFKTFNTGDVLSAADTNGYLMQGVLVFASATARDAAITSPQEGQFAYLKDTNLTTSYTGSAWVTETSGLVSIKTQTIGSAVASVNVTGAFSSTYDNYLIVVSGGSASANQNMTLKLGSTTTGYYAGGTFAGYAAATFGQLQQSNGASFPFAGFSTTAGNVAYIIVQSPNQAKATTYITQNANNNSGTGGSYFVGGYLDNTTQYTDFTLAVAGTMTGGVINVYGYKLG